MTEGGVIGGVGGSSTVLVLLLLLLRYVAKAPGLMIREKVHNLSSCIKSSTAYHAKDEYAMPRHHPQRSFGAMYACACKWSFTGIALSEGGGPRLSRRTHVLLAVMAGEELFW